MSEGSRRANAAQRRAGACVLCVFVGEGREGSGRERLQGQFVMPQKRASTGASQRTHQVLDALPIVSVLYCD